MPSLIAPGSGCLLLPGIFGVEDRPGHGTGLQRPGDSFPNAPLGDVYVFGDHLGTMPPSTVHNGGDDCCANPEKRVKDRVVRPSHGKKKTLNEFHRKLTRVNGLLNVVALDVWYFPDIAGILPQRVAGEATYVRPLKMALPRIFLGHADGVKVEEIVVRLREPVDRLVSARKASPAMEAVLEMPDDPISHLEVEVPEYRVEHGVERDDGSLFDIVAYLPTYVSVRSENTNTFGYDRFLLRYVVTETQSGFIFFANIVGRRSDNQLHATVGDGSEKVQAVPMIHGRSVTWTVLVRYRRGLRPCAVRQGERSLKIISAWSATILLTEREKARCIGCYDPEGQAARR